MTGLVRLRVSLADRSGALAQVATVVGLHGGNIRSVDVHRSGHESAVDDLVVDFAVDPDTEAMRTDLAMHASAELLSSTPTEADDPVEAALREVLEMVEGGTFADGAARLCGETWSWTLGADEARRSLAGRAALEEGNVVCVLSTDLPPHVAAAADGEAMVLAVPGTGTPSHAGVAFVARPTGLTFTDTELARVRALAAIQARLA